MGHRFHTTCTIDDCERPHIARGYCHRHYREFRRNGGPVLDKPPTPVLDYLKGVVLGFDGDDCLIWPFARSDVGYASVAVEGKTQIASRYVCRKTSGPPPSRSHHAAHSCGNGHLGCVNPKHLSWKTPTENNADKKVHGTLLFGERAPSAKLTEQQVQEIRGLKGRELQADIAERYGISNGHVSYIQTRRTWHHLGEAKS